MHPGRGWRGAVAEERDQKRCLLVRWTLLFIVGVARTASSRLVSAWGFDVLRAKPPSQWPSRPLQRADDDAYTLIIVCCTQFHGWPPGPSSLFPLACSSTTLPCVTRSP